MKILTTHHNPHLDDIAGIWLFKKFHPDFSSATIEFRGQGQPIPESEVGIGIGGGQYDEHKGGDLTQSAATLVLADVVTHTQEGVERRAVERMMQWVCDEDHAAFMGQNQHVFAFPAMILGLSLSGHDSAATTDLGLKILDGLFETTKEYEQVINDAREAVEFDSPWGRGVGLRTEAHSTIIGEWAYAAGYKLFAVENPKSQYRSIRALPSAEGVNFTSAFEKVNAREPEASWYLHQSKRMLLCGSDVSRGTTFSKLSIQELISCIV